MIKYLLAGIEWGWNIRFVKGYRTKIAQFALGGLAIYQEIATSSEVAARLGDFPDIPAAYYVPIMAYFAAKVAQFAKENVPTNP
jgi:hypothetical protein